MSKLRGVWFIPAIWDGEKLSLFSDRAVMFDSYEQVPDWLVERVAVMRLLEDGEVSPLGKREIDIIIADKMHDDDYHIVLQPGDPDWDTVR